MATECPRCHSRLVTTKVAVDAVRYGAVAIGALLLYKAITHAEAGGSSTSGLRRAVVTPATAALLKHLASQHSESNAKPHKQLRCWRCQHTFPSND